MSCMFSDCPVVNHDYADVYYANDGKDAVAVAGDGIIDDGEVVGVGDGKSFLAGSNNGTEGPGNDFVVVEHALNESAPIVVEARDADYDYDDYDYDGVDDSHRSAWIAHGTIGALAFGLLVPLAISSALFRDRMPDLWIYVHVGINSVVFVLAVVGVAVAMVNMHSMGVPWEGHMKEMHHVAGLSLLMIVSFQAANGFLRPPREFVDGVPSPTDGGVGFGVGGVPTLRSRMDAFAFRPTLRGLWRLVHKSTGLLVFGLGAYQVRGGLGLYAGRYGTPDYGDAFVWYVCWLVGVVGFAKFWTVWSRRKSEPNFSE